MSCGVEEELCLLQLVWGSGLSVRVRLGSGIVNRTEVSPAGPTAAVPPDLDNHGKPITGTAASDINVSYHDGMAR
jgi:hypothetical protein